MLFLDDVTPLTTLAKSGGYVFQKDEIFLSNYIANIIFEKKSSFVDADLKKEDGTYRKFSFRNIDPETGLVVIYREDDNGSLVSYLSTINLEMLHSKVFTVENTHLKITVLFKKPSSFKTVSN